MATDLRNALASLGSGVAPSAGFLIAARGVQGIGGAIMLATTIALINTCYEGRDRGTAFGVWGAVVGAHDPSTLATALSAGQAQKMVGSAAPQARAGPADLLGTASADGLREVFLACGIAGVVGGLLVLALVRAVPPGVGERRPEERTAEPAEVH